MLREILKRFRSRKKPMELTQSVTSASQDLATGPSGGWNGAMTITQSQPTKRTHKFTNKQTDFLLAGIVYIGRPKRIAEEFEKEFGMTVSVEWIKCLRKSPKHQPTIERFREEYERGLHEEYLVSKRRRINLHTEISEKALDHYEQTGNLKALQVASEQVAKISEEVEPKRGFGDLNVLHLQQTNQYANLTLQEIQVERAKLLGRLEETINRGRKEEPNTTIERGLA